MHPGRLLPDENLARDVLPPVLLATGLFAASALGMLMLFQYRADAVPYLLMAALVVSIGASGVLLRRARIVAAGAVIAYAVALLPILSSVTFGLERNPLIYLSVLGVAIAGLLVGPRAPFAVARDSLLLLVLLIAGLPAIGRADFPLDARFGAVMVMAVLLFGMAALTWVSAHRVRGTINWARETASSAERREALFRKAQADLELTLRERDQLNDQLYRQSLELESARVAAETAYRSKANFMATMSHELRTPLNIIIGFSTAMVEHPEIYDGAPIPPAVVADLSEIRRSGQHLLSLINDILDLARVEAGRIELNCVALPIVPLLDEMLQTAKGLLKDRPVLLRCEYDDDLPNVVADEMRVRQVLLNLISNACKFTGVGEVALGARADGHEVTIWVRDTGIGIAAADQTRIFNHFEQIDSHDLRPQTGTGLGLAISRWLVDLHGGRIWLESELGQGSTFSFTLPRIHTSGSAVNGQAPLKARALGE